MNTVNVVVEWLALLLHIVTYGTDYMRGLYNKDGFISHTITIHNDFLFTALEAIEIITLEITVLY
jgi:hypothetical protein